MTAVLTPLVFDAPLVNPAPSGLYAATAWQPVDGPPRWLDAGVQVRPRNYGGGTSFGVWTAPWTASQSDLTVDDVKTGHRPNIDEEFPAMTVWAYDEGKFHAEPQSAATERAQQVLRLEEQKAVEAAFSERLVSDAGATNAASDIVAAVSFLEGVLAKTNTLGFIHAGAHWAAYASQAQLIVRSGTSLKTPLGHTWVFGGGYVEGLSDVLVATSQPFGWRTDISVRDATNLKNNRFAAIAERSLVIGYEAAVAAAEIN